MQIEILPFGIYFKAETPTKEKIEEVNQEIQRLLAELEQGDGKDEHVSCKQRGGI
ncbi:hypothetical protein [Tepidibacillus sp. LV47]|uniref:hypothetical protein n=1 Tax=Tepidibacillus sp. LV47 TaxID=3398228 RepID=UPI003AAAE71F